MLSLTTEHREPLVKVGSAPGARQGRGEPGQHRAGREVPDIMEPEMKSEPRMVPVLLMLSPLQNCPFLRPPTARFSSLITSSGFLSAPGRQLSPQPHPKWGWGSRSGPRDGWMGLCWRLGLPVTPANMRCSVANNKSQNLEGTWETDAFSGTRFTDRKSVV